MPGFSCRSLPEVLRPLTELALDLRWTWSRHGDQLWELLDPVTWAQTENPWVLLQDVSQERLQAASRDPVFLSELRSLVAEREAYLSDKGYLAQAARAAGLRTIAYFSLEFGLGEALPLYAGGLGVLAGDFLKAASDLGVPVVGVGLLYQEGYFRQMIDLGGRQIEAYPYNDPTTLPIEPVTRPDGAWLRVTLNLPGRKILLRVWRARVGRVALYLLDSNDPLNAPADRGITGKLYGGGQEQRLMQEIVLGIGGWRMLEMLGLMVDICHLNEGHAAFAVLERARAFMKAKDVNFWEALCATRAGNVFTTHTPVAAGFDKYSPELIDRYLPYFRQYISQLGLSLSEVLSLGRRDAEDECEPFNMAYLALRGCAHINGVSRLHAKVSRGIFAPLFPRWPEREIPVAHVTNGVHVPTWACAAADELWAQACGPAPWRGDTGLMAPPVRALGDEAIWSMRGAGRRHLVECARQRFANHLGQRGADTATMASAQQVLDPNALTIAFARRFAEYKRPQLLLHDADRLARLLCNPERPVQLIIAGKAHPADEVGKDIVGEWLRFVRRPEVRHRTVFLEDYDLTLAQHLVQGVDVWVNMPRRPLEACGTSGMKVLANGGLNVSVRDGWWAEAYEADVGWAFGDGGEHPGPEQDPADAEDLFAVLEGQVVPAFYNRDARGIPAAWVAKIRASMSRLAPRFSANRMVCEYMERLYEPAAAAHRRRVAEGAGVVKAMHQWCDKLNQHWHDLRFGNLDVHAQAGATLFRVQVYLGDLAPDDVQVELYGEPAGDEAILRIPMQKATSIPGATNGFIYEAQASDIAAADLTPRIIPRHAEAFLPTEAPWILWQR